jgi:MFS family permease
MLLSSLGTSSANVALPTLARAFGASFAAVQWIVVAYLLAITVSIVSVGRLADRVGRRRLLQAGLLLFTVASALCSLAPTLSTLLLARGLQGLGAAVMMALTIAFVREVVADAETGRAMGLLGTMSAVGTALGPSLGGATIAVLHWRAIFLLNVPLGLLAAGLVPRLLPADPPTTREPGGFDRVGTLLLAATLAAYALAMTLSREHFGPGNFALLLAAALGVAAFVHVQRRASAPLVPPAMLRDPALRARLVANLLVSAVVMATLVVGPFYLSQALGLSAGVVGIVMSIGPIVAGLTGVPAGRAVDRVGTHAATLAGLAGVAVGALALALAPETLGIPGYVGPIAILTGGYALFQAANNTAVMRRAAASERGVVSATLNLSRNLGLITGTTVMGAVFAAASGAAEIARALPVDVASGMRLTFAVAAALAGLAIAVASGARAARPLALALALLACPSAAWARATPPEEPDGPTLTERAVADNGLSLRSADGASSVRLVGLLQVRYTHAWSDLVAPVGVLSVPRARVGLLGSVSTPDLRYMLVAELGGGDPRLLFLTVDYALVDEWLTVRVGQFKRPLSRSFLTLASMLSMVDRPPTVGPGAFGDDTDVGVMVHNGTSHGVEYSAGVFNGAGAGVVPDRAHPLLAARVGYNSAGLQPYVESDLKGGGVRWGIAAAGMLDVDTDASGASSATGLVDATVKVRGLALSAAQYVGFRQGGPRWSDQSLTAIGHHTQLGYTIARRVEPVVRYALRLPIDGGPPQHDVAGGLNLFFHGHAIKWQTFATTSWPPREGGTLPDLRVQSQVSLSF